MTLDFDTNAIRFHIPGMSCEHHVDLLLDAITSVEADAEVLCDREMREIATAPLSARTAEFRTAIAGAGFCIDR